MTVRSRISSLRGAVLSALTGCLMCCSLGCPPSGSQPGVGDTVPPPPPRELSDIVDAIDRNAALLDRALWSPAIQVTARFTDQDGKEHVFNFDGTLLYQPPRNLRMDLRPGLGGTVMQIGSNQQDYWVWIEPELRRMWWGRHRHLGKPCAEKIIVRPDQLLCALGVGGLPTESEVLLGPARKFGKKYDILYYMKRGADGGFLLDREYWVDRLPPFQIRVVILRDRFGQTAMSAFLEDYQPAWEGGPVVAHSLSIFWPQDDGKFTMSMRGARGIPDTKVKHRSFDRPTADRLPADVRANVVQVDAECDQRTPPTDDQ